MKKTYVIDTNVLIQAPYALNCFEDNHLVIPLVVIEELDNLKKAEGERGINAREAIRIFESLRNKGDLIAGISLSSGGTIRIEKNHIDVALPQNFSSDKSDNRILKVCKGIMECEDSQGQVILVTKDLLLRLKAQILDIKSEDFSTEQISEEDANYSGRDEVYIPEEYIKSFKNQGVSFEQVYQITATGTKTIPQLIENQFLILRSDQTIKKTLLGRVSKNKIIPLKHKKETPYGVSPKNVGQYFMQEALMTNAEEAPLVIIQGMAGTAKTFYSLAVGLERIYNNSNNEYRRILICRPNTPFDDDIGYLPGSEKEKIAPLMRPVIDNLEQILDSDPQSRYEDENLLSDKIEELFERNIIQAEALTFIRGRSISQTYLIIDEAQNMTPSQVKGIITRAGAGTKIILLGDPNQIDKPFLDNKTNGLSYAAKHMKGSPSCWQITLSAEECERSLLAMEAISRL